MRRRTQLREQKRILLLWSGRHDALLRACFAELRGEQRHGVAMTTPAEFRSEPQIETPFLESFAPALVEAGATSPRVEGGVRQIG